MAENLSGPTRRAVLQGAVAGAAAFAVGAVALPQGAGAATLRPHAVRVGNTIPNQAVQPGAYDAGMTQAAADTKFCKIVGRGINGGQNLAITKKFWNPSNWNTANNDLQNYAAMGTAVIFAIMPAFPVTKIEQANLTQFLATIKGFGFGRDNSFVVPWQEPEVKGKVTPAQYQAGLEGYGPIINAAGLHLVCDIGSGAGDAVLASYANAAIAAMKNGVKLAGLAQDFYAPTYVRGVRLGTLPDIADANGLRFGVFEHGCRPSQFSQAACANFMDHVRTFMVDRRNAGKPCLPVLYYDGQGSPTGVGDITSPIGQDPSTPAPDFRIKLFQQLVDELA